MTDGHDEEFTFFLWWRKIRLFLSCHLDFCADRQERGGSMMLRTMFMIHPLTMNTYELIKRKLYLFSCWWSQHQNCLQMVTPEPMVMIITLQGIPTREASVRQAARHPHHRQGKWHWWKQAEEIVGMWWKYAMKICANMWKYVETCNENIARHSHHWQKEWRRWKQAKEIIGMGWKYEMKICENV